MDSAVVGAAGTPSFDNARSFGTTRLCGGKKSQALGMTKERATVHKESLLNRSL